MKNKYKVGDEFVDHVSLHVKITKVRQDYYETLETNSLTKEKDNGIRNEAYFEKLDILEMKQV